MPNFFSGPLFVRGVALLALPLILPALWFRCFLVRVPNVTTGTNNILTLKCSFVGRQRCRGSRLKLEMRRHVLSMAYQTTIRHWHYWSIIVIIRPLRCLKFGHKFLDSKVNLYFVERGWKRFTTLQTPRQRETASFLLRPLSKYKNRPICGVRFQLTFIREYERTPGKWHRRHRWSHCVQYYIEF